MRMRRITIEIRVRAKNLVVETKVVTDVVVHYSSCSFILIYTQMSRNCNMLSFILFLFPIATGLLDDNVDPVSEHDGDHHQAREARHEGEHAGVQLRVIRLTVVAIFCRVPEQKEMEIKVLKSQDLRLT